MSPAWLLLLACADKLPPPPGATDTAPTDTTDTAVTDTSVDSGATTDDYDVTLGEPVSCEAPLADVAYADVAEAMGLASLAGGEGAAAVADFDGDGDLDIALAYGDAIAQPLQIYYRDGDSFVARGVDGEEASGLGLADLDGDGDLDLAVGGEAPWIARNDGDGFSPAVSIPSADEQLHRELVPADFDGDGDVDLAVVLTGDDGPLNYLLRNQGGFDFEASSPFPAAHAGREGFDGLVLDWDGDRRPDLYVVNDRGASLGPNALYRNTGDGTFEDASEACACGLTMSGMGGSAGDYDGDGVQDIYLAATDRNVLLRGLGDGTYADVTATAGADPIEAAGDMAWGTALLDFDNDGDLDIAVAQGDFYSDEDEDPDGALGFNLLRQDDGAFTDVAGDYGLAGDAYWRAIVPADHNGDGVLDLLVTDAAAGPRLYLSQGCTAAAWLAVEAPLDSEVRVTAGGRTRTRWVRTDQGFAGARAPEVWFGLGGATTVDRLEVILPWTGASVVVEEPFEARRRVRVQ